MPEASQGTLPPDVLESSALPPALKGLRARSTIKATSSFLDELEAERAPATPTGALLPDGAYSNVRQIVFGDRKIQIWYQAPYPEEVARVPQGTLWLCEHCLKYLKTQYQLERHRVGMVLILAGLQVLMVSWHRKNAEQNILLATKYTETVACLSGKLMGAKAK